MKRRLTIALATLFLMSILPSPSTQADDLEGNSACQTCQQQADDDWARCVEEEAGGDVGDVDCAGKRQQAKSRCLIQYCIW